MKCKINGCGKEEITKNLCSKHYTQIQRHGKILEHTVFDPNEFIEKINHIEITLRNRKGEFTKTLLIDKSDKHLLNYKWSIDSEGYPQARINGEKRRLHEFLFGKNKQKERDHKNGNRLDNRRKNLRVCTHQQNTFNSKVYKNNKSGFIGVFWNGYSWSAYITINKRRIYLGKHKNKEKAIAVRKEAEKKYFGEFAPNKRQIKRKRKSV